MNVEFQIDGFPDSVPGCWSLFVAAARESGTEALRTALENAEVACLEPYPAVLRVDLSADALYKTTQWCSVLEPSDLETIRCHLTAGGEEPSVAQLMQSQRLSSLLAWINGQWLVDVLEGNRLVTYFHSSTRHRFAQLTGRSGTADCRRMFPQ